MRHTFKRGDTVTHDSRGPGRVVGVNRDGSVDVAFDGAGGVTLCAPSFLSRREPESVCILSGQDAARLAREVSPWRA